MPESSTNSQLAKDKSYLAKLEGERSVPLDGRVELGSVRLQCSHVVHAYFIVGFGQLVARSRHEDLLENTAIP